MKFGGSSHSPDDLALDEIDRNLVRELQVDAKISLKSVGAKVGLSAPAVMERVRKLEQAGVILGYYAHVNARSVGLDITAFIGVRVTDTQCIEEFEQWVVKVPQILECHHVTGGHTLLLKVKIHNTHALERLISRIRSLEGVAGTETMIVLSTHTERVQLALDAEEPSDEIKAPRNKTPRSSRNSKRKAS